MANEPRFSFTVGFFFWLAALIVALVGLGLHFFGGTVNLLLVFLISWVLWLLSQRF